MDFNTKTQPWISLHHAKGNILVYSGSCYGPDLTRICVLISDIPNISTVSILVKFAFGQGKVVNINKIVEADSKVFFK